MRPGPVWVAFGRRHLRQECWRRFSTCLSVRVTRQRPDLYACRLAAGREDLVSVVWTMSPFPRRAYCLLLSLGVSNFDAPGATIDDAAAERSTRFRQANLELGLSGWPHDVDAARRAGSACPQFFPTPALPVPAASSGFDFSSAIEIKDPPPLCRVKARSWSMPLASLGSANRKADAHHLSSLAVPSMSWLATIGQGWRELA